MRAEPNADGQTLGEIVDRDGNNEQSDLTQCRAFQLCTPRRKVLVRKRFVQPIKQTHSQKDGDHCDASRYRSLPIPCFGRVERQVPRWRLGLAPNTPRSPAGPPRVQLPAPQLRGIRPW